MTDIFSRENPWVEEMHYCEREIYEAERAIEYYSDRLADAIMCARLWELDSEDEPEIHTKR